jgi:UDP-glucose 4-epimerase
MSQLNDYNGREVLITGGMGMIGSTVAHQLVEYGANVTIVDSCLAPYGANLANLEGIESSVQVNIADIRDVSAMNENVKNKDVVFNFAGQVSHNDSLTSPELDMDINYKGHVNLLEACRRNNPGVRVLHSGSRLQFGRIVSNPVAENHPSSPLTPYAVNKQAAENYYLFASRVPPRLESVCFRIANPYGPRSQMKHSKYNMINWFIRQAMENKEITIFGDGSQIRDYIYVEDLAAAFAAAGIQEFPADGPNGHVYNVGSGQGTRFIDMARMVIKSVGRGSINLVEWPEAYQNVETGDFVTDISKIKSELSWQPAVELQDGIDRTVRFFEDAGPKYWSASERMTVPTTPQM